MLRFFLNYINNIMSKENSEEEKCQPQPDHCKLGWAPSAGSPRLGPAVWAACTLPMEQEAVFFLPDDRTSFKVLSASDGLHKLSQHSGPRAPRRQSLPCPAHRAGGEGGNHRVPCARFPRTGQAELGLHSPPARARFPGASAAWSGKG